MGYITLQNIKIFATHGCLTEEAKIGSEYCVNVRVKADLKPSAQSDLLKDTVDYVALNRIVKEEMAIRSQLLEHVAERIINRILKELPMVKKVEVDVAKINPPIGGNVDRVIVTMKGKRKKIANQ
ncbi:MAG: dihydroneopterin aldolase [Flavobacteriia bacterium]|nr:MAG: dihydroneopterin aldolase [Flavobacteriia bacterium]